MGSDDTSWERPRTLSSLSHIDHYRFNASKQNIVYYHISFSPPFFASGLNLLILTLPLQEKAVIGKKYIKFRVYVSAWCPVQLNCSYIHKENMLFVTVSNLRVLPGA